MIFQNRYVKYGLTAFCTVAAILLFYDTVFGSRGLQRLGSHFISAMDPIVYGAAMAYLLSPIVNFFDRKAKRCSKKPGTKGRPVPLGIRSLSIFLTWAIVSLVLALLGYVLLPELYKSLLQLFYSVEEYYLTISRWIEQLLEMFPSLGLWASDLLDTYYGNLENWFASDLLPQASEFITLISGEVLGVLGVFGELLIGVIVSVYFLATKEAIAGYVCRLVHGLFSQRHVYWILHGAHKADYIFAGFIRGKLLDSLIIGFLCFFGCYLLNMPYTPLVAVTIGITNVIPFFGPFLGAIPCSFLILLADPLKGLYFILFIILLQQFDGNILGPKILGDKTGLSSLWVIFAILVGGSFFGVLGMFLGVPVCACIYNLVNFHIENRLKKNSMPTDVMSYVGTGEQVVQPLQENTAQPEKTSDGEDSDPASR